MKFRITCHNPDDANIVETYMYDNMSNVVVKPNGRKATFWNEPRFEPIKCQGSSKPAFVFGPDRPTGATKYVRSLKIQLGLKCNYKCKYCSQSLFREETKNLKAPNTDEILAFMQLLNDAGIRLRTDGQIELWGGEPLVYWKQLQVLIPLLNEKFKGIRISMVTNGSLLTKEKVDFLYKHHTHITISHDGPGFNLRDDTDPLFDAELKSVWLYAFERSMEENSPVDPLTFNVVMSPANCDIFKIRQFFAENFHPSARFHFEGIMNYHSEGQSIRVFDAKAKAQITQNVFTALTDGWDDETWFSLKTRALELMSRIIHRVPAKTIDGKCNDIYADTLVCTLKGDVIACQNCNPEQYKIGDLVHLGEVKNDKFTHWRLRENCFKCVCLSSCRGGCPYLGETEYRINCGNERILHNAIFVGTWYHLTGMIVDNIESVSEEGDFTDVITE